MSDKPQTTDDAVKRAWTLMTGTPWEESKTTTPAPMSDAQMLELLAKWFDATRHHEDNEVQIDLRRIASRLRRLDGE